MAATAPAQRREGMRGLRGKNVLVTGGISGIGQAIAVRFAEYGANVAINYPRRPRERRRGLHPGQTSHALRGLHEPWSSE